MSSNIDIFLTYFQTVPIHIPFRVFVELEEVNMGTQRKSNLFIFSESAIYSQGYGLLNKDNLELLPKCISTAFITCFMEQ